MATNPGTVLQVVCSFNMLYIGCQYQVIKKVKKKRKADLPYLSFLQDEIGNAHIFFWPYTTSCELVRLKPDFPFSASCRALDCVVK